MKSFNYVHCCWFSNLSFFSHSFISSSIITSSFSLEHSNFTSLSLSSSSSLFFFSEKYPSTTINDYNISSSSSSSSSIEGGGMKISSSSSDSSLSLSSSSFSSYSYGSGGRGGEIFFDLSSCFSSSFSFLSLSLLMDQMMELEANGGRRENDIQRSSSFYVNQVLNEKNVNGRESVGSKNGVK
jgi:hypothetical protein